jgi:tRNA (cmo5U34)-methyltransferase
LLVVFENIKPETKEGVRIGLERWASFQVRQGKTKEAVRKHMRRFGRDFFPITPSEHLALFRRAGFRKAGMFWLSYLQAGFYAIR